MHPSSQQFQQIRDEAWRSGHVDAMECRKCEEWIARLRAIWDGDRRAFAGVAPGSLDREAARELASVLRMAEQAMTHTARLAAQSVAKGYTVDGLDGLLARLAEVRALIVLPVARMMAERDPDGRTPEQIAHLLVRRVQFQDGRAVLTEEAVADLPSPFEGEAVP